MKEEPSEYSGNDKQKNYSDSGYNSSNEQDKSTDLNTSNIVENDTTLQNTPDLPISKKTKRYSLDEAYNISSNIKHDP